MSPTVRDQTSNWRAVSSGVIWRWLLSEYNTYRLERMQQSKLLEEKIATNSNWFICTRHLSSVNCSKSCCEGDWRHFCSASLWTKIWAERVCVSVCVCLSTTISSALHVRSLPAFVDVMLWHLLLMSCHVSDDWASRDCRKTVIQGGPISGATDSWP